MAQKNVELTPAVAKALIYRILRETLDNVKFKKRLHTVFQKERYAQPVVQMFDDAYQEFLHELEAQGKIPGEN